MALAKEVELQRIVAAAQQKRKEHEEELLKESMDFASRGCLRRRSRLPMLLAVAAMLATSSNHDFPYRK